VEQGSRLDEAAVSELDEYRRYLLTEDGVSPWAVPGTPGGMSLVTGNERDEWGLVSTAAANRVAMMDKRARKLAALRPQLPDAVRWGDASAGVGILGIGMEAGVMVEASERLAAEGIGLAGLRPRTLWPVPDEVIEFIQSCQRVYVVEHNAEGQLAHLLISAGAPSQRITSILRYDGLPFTPGGLAGSIREAEAT